tara:strand:- start:422 stop:673 length:252 start_codon:yes stop_codon:yes gene_type:complete
VQVLRDFSVAGPGFVNARVTKEFLVGRVNETLKVGEGDNNAGKGKGKGKKRKVVVDFSSPNIAKVSFISSPLTKKSLKRITHS